MSLDEMENWFHIPLKGIVLPILGPNVSVLTNMHTPLRNLEQFRAKVDDIYGARVLNPGLELHWAKPNISLYFDPNWY